MSKIRDRAIEAERLRNLKKSKKEKKRLKEKEKLRLKKIEEKLNKIKEPEESIQKTTPTTKKRKNYYRIRKRKLAAKKKAELKRLEPCWKIILVNRKKIITDVLYTRDKDSAIQKFNKILFENNSNIRFPKKILVAEHEILKADYELLLLKGRKDIDPQKTLYRNEIGRLEEVKTNNPKWIIYNKETFYFEETFWVYGYNPRHERKNFIFILNEILYKNLNKNGYIQKKVILYNNKLVVEDDGGDIDIVICKTIEESIRLYNELEKECKQNKIKTIFWAGISKGTSKTILFDKIQKKTNWNKVKINRTSTRP